LQRLLPFSSLRHIIESIYYPAAEECQLSKRLLITDASCVGPSIIVAAAASDYALTCPGN
jgi:hypothetical protein